MINTERRRANRARRLYQAIACWDVDHFGGDDE